MASLDNEQIKRITANIEETYQLLRLLARNISGLLAVGRATCADVKAYNLYALTIYNTQRGMLTSLRAAGEQGVPELPPSPTLFAWKNVAGADMYLVDCSKETTSLSGALAQAFGAATDPNTTYLSSEQIKIVTQDKNVFLPEKDIPSLAELTAAAEANGTLGSPVVIAIIVAGILLAISIGIAAFSKYLQENSIQEETTKRAKLQVEVFTQFTEQRLSCYDKCISSGGSIPDCQNSCKALVDKPKIDVDPKSGMKKDTGFLEKVGFAVVGVGLLFVGYKIYQRQQDKAAAV